MSKKIATHRVISLTFATAALLASGFSVASDDVKIAFIGDQNEGSSPEAILSLVASENTDMVLLQGDPGYTNNNARDWENDINYALGSNFPVLAVRGLHENSEWPEYQRLIQERIDRVSELACSGDTGVKAKCSFGNVDVIQVAPSISGDAGTVAENKYAEFIKSSITATDNRWRICSWQKPRAIEQGSLETEPFSWSVYNACLDAGAIIAMAHSDSYQRTHLLNSYPSRRVVNQYNDMSLLPGQSFAFLSRSDARFIQGGSNDADYFASIYAADQADQTVAGGALFCSFGRSTADCYFKTIDGSVHDQFTLALAGTSGGVVSETAPADLTSGTVDLSDDAESADSTPSATSAITTPKPVLANLELPQAPESDASDAPTAFGPQGLNENLPMMGMFYGHPAALAKSPANTAKMARHFLRFRATKNLKIDEAEFSVRVGEGYSSGSGGVIQYVIFSDDGSSNHYPNLDDRYGESESRFVPGDVSRNVGYDKRLKMVNTRELVAGRLYHLGIINWDTSSGRIPTNGSLIPPRDSTEYVSWDRMALGPWFSQGAAWTVSDNGNGYGPLRKVDLSRDVQPWFAIKYSDGTWEGTFYTNSDYPTAEPYDTSRSAAANVQREVAYIDGQYAASQPFTVTQQDRIVDGLWVHFGHHKSGGRPNGSPLKAELLDDSGKVLSSVEYQPDMELYETTLPENRTGNEFLDYRLRMAGDWQYKPFSADRSTNVRLEVGKSYSVRFTASKGANFMMLATPTVSLSDTDLATRDRNSFQDGDAARRSEDGGKTFPKEVDWGQRSWGGKFGMLFTIKGQVTHAKDFNAPQ